ncbi:MAG TPA: flagellar hook-length control protein FliK [Rhodocyclaceae bacterium]|nr:flagellar hook-length control protein FliK [Rhodocyclaceae bacterium]
MAELRMTPIAAITPATQAPPSNANGAQGADPDAGSQQQSFAHVLNGCRQAGGTEKKASSSDQPAATDKASAQAAPDQTSAQAPAQPDAATLAAVMALNATTSPAVTTVVATAATAIPTVAAADAIGNLDKTNGIAATDQNISLTSVADGTASIANPAVIPVKIAPDTATIAGKTTQNNSLDAGLDPSASKTSSYQAPVLSTDAKSTDKRSPGEDKPLVTTTESAAKTAAEATNKTALSTAQNVGEPTSNQNTNQVNHALDSLAAQGLNVQGTLQPASAAQHAISTPVSAPGWAEDVGQKLAWTANHDNGRATFVLTPPQMGRVEVSINVTGDQASASFVSASPAAREALQDAMPRLREVLAQAGIQLGQADVSAGQSGQSQADTRGSRSSGGHSPTNTVAGTNIDIATTRSGRIQLGRGLIDTFA